MILRNTLLGAPLGPLQNAPPRPQGVNWQGDGDPNF